MLARLRSVISVVMLVAALAGLPAPVAHAEPRVVSVATFDLAPFVMTRDGVKTGFTIDLLEEIAKRTGWDFTFVEGGTTAGLLKTVAEGRAETGACAVSITSERSESFDFSQPIMNAGLQIAIPVSAMERTQPGLRDFLALLFSKSMLVWLVAALVLTIVPAHITWLLERRHSESMVSRSYFPGIFEAFGWGLGMLAAAPDDAPRHWQTRLLTLVWAFISVIFVAYFTATLTANLTVEKFESKITSPTDLIGKRVCTVAETTSSAHLSNLGVEHTAVPVVEDCYAGMRNQKFDAIVFDAPVLQYYVLNDGAGAATIAGPVFHDDDYGIVFPLGSKLRRQVDDALLAIRESGDLDLIRQKWLGS